MSAGKGGFWEPKYLMGVVTIVSGLANWRLLGNQARSTIKGCDGVK